MVQALIIMANKFDGKHPQRFYLIEGSHYGFLVGFVGFVSKSGLPFLEVLNLQ